METIPSPGAPEAVAPIRHLSEVIGDTLAQLQLDPALRKSYQEWKHRHDAALAEPPSPMEARFPLLSGQARSAAVKVTVALIEKRAAELRLEAATGMLRSARVAAHREIEVNEVTPSEGDWELSPYRLALRNAELQQSPTEVFEVVRGMASTWSGAQLERAAEGCLPPMVRERIGPIGPAQFYADVARFLLQHPDAAREQLLAVLQLGRSAIAPLYHLASLVDETQKIQRSAH